jgi:hypothetical protein
MVTSELTGLYSTLESNMSNFSDYFEICNFFRHARDEFERKGFVEDVRIILIEQTVFGFILSNGKLCPFAQIPNGNGEFIDMPNLREIDPVACNHLKMRYDSSKSPIIKARYAHVLWEAPCKDWHFAKKAIEDYLDVIKIFEEKDKLFPKGKFGHNIIEIIYSILVIGRSINFDKELLKSEVFRLLKSFNPTSASAIFLKYKLILMMLEFPTLFSKSDLYGLNVICWNLGESLKQQNNFGSAENFFELGEKLDVKLGNPNNKWRQKIAELYECQMVSSIANAKSDAAANFCLRAIENYKKIKNFDKVTELSKTLSTLKIKFTYHEFSQEIDLSEYILHCKKIGYEISSFTSFEIIRILCYEKALIPNLEVVTRRANEIDQTYIAHKLFPIVLYDQNGNSIQVFSTDSEKKYHSILEQYKLELEVRNCSLIREILLAVLKEGKFNEQMLYKYLKHYSWIGASFEKVIPNNKSISYNWLDLVQPSLNEFFTQMGIQITFSEYQPNFILFIDSFILKIEGIIRELCKLLGVPTFVSKRDGITYEKTLEELLREERLNDVFYDDEIIFFKFVLIEKAGYNLRNRIAHALAIPQEYGRDYAFYLIITFLKLCNVRDPNQKYSKWAAVQFY